MDIEAYGLVLIPYAVHIRQLPYMYFFLPMLYCTV